MYISILVNFEIMSIRKDVFELKHVINFDDDKFHQYFIILSVCQKKSKGLNV